MAVYTYILQLLDAKGTWSNLRDPHTGAVADGFFGVVDAPEAMLVDIAQEVMKRAGETPLERRVLFFAGDRRKQRLTADDVCGVVTADGDRVVPYSDGAGSPATYTYAIQYLARGADGSEYWKIFGPDASGTLRSTSAAAQLAGAIVEHFMEGVDNPQHIVRVVVWTGDRANGPLRAEDSAAIAYHV